VDIPRVGKIGNVEAGRGIAAVLVVLFHVTKYYFSNTKFWAGGGVRGFFLFGHAGVEFFFVLSGFIMIWVHRPDIGHRDKIAHFAWKRFVRIYPFFWMVLATTVLLAFIIPSLGKAYYRNPLTILESTFLIGHDPLRAIVFVSWTLWHEIIFYLFCALAIGFPRIGIPAFIGWTLACIGIPAASISTPWPGYLTEFINVLFALGVGVGLILQRWKLPMAGAALAAGVAIFLATAVVVDYSNILPEWSTRVLFGLGAALALAGAVELERSRGLRAPKWMGVLGAASFSIYLTHILVLTALTKVASILHLTTKINALFAFVGLSGLVIMVGVAVHFLVERPVLTFAKSVKNRLSLLRSAPASEAS
jgi:exopolysaccharide production protein ExoZ